MELIKKFFTRRDLKKQLKAEEREVKILLEMVLDGTLKQQDTFFKKEYKLRKDNIKDLKIKLERL